MTSDALVEGVANVDPAALEDQMNTPGGLPGYTMSVAH
jgi:hypothetical protein